MLYAYDLDGTLAHTRSAVYAAYQAVGITPPSDFYYRPWHEWAPASSEHLHDEKNKVYLRIAKDLVKPTPFVDLYRRAPGPILTGASLSAAEEVLRIIGLEDVELHDSLSIEEKISALTNFGRTGIYFDDDMKAVKRIHEETGWTTVFAKF